MANIKSAIKRIRVTKRNEERNKMVKSGIKGLFKKASALITSGSKDAEKAVKEALRKLDKAVSKGVVHKKTASRKKSRLVRSLNKSSKK